jgi:hypothetical protein
MLPRCYLFFEWLYRGRAEAAIDAIANHVDRNRNKQSEARNYAFSFVSTKLSSKVLVLCIVQQHPLFKSEIKEEVFKLEF